MNRHLTSGPPDQFTMKANLLMSMKSSRSHSKRLTTTETQGLDFPKNILYIRLCTIKPYIRIADPDERKDLRRKQL
jgi:hypothetical protein